MFGLFKGKKQKISDEVGKCIHRQLSQALGESVEAFVRPEEAVFFSAYLNSLLWGFAQQRNAVGDWVLEGKYQEEICQRVLPDRLWDIYQRGQGMYELKDNGTFNVEEVHEEGTSAGISDSCQPLKSASNLYLYVTGKSLSLLS